MRYKDNSDRHSGNSTVGGLSGIPSSMQQQEDSGLSVPEFAPQKAKQIQGRRIVKT